ncbi:hypothetical protein ACFL5Z_04780 [Planctomycetota bacterium]
MKALSNEEFAQYMKDMADESAGFEVTAMYDPDGDCIEFIFESDNFRAERIDDLVTVYYSESTGEIIGSLIKGVSQFLTKHPNFGVLIGDGPIRLSHLFLAGVLSQEGQRDEITVVAYRKLIERAEQTQAQAEMCLN